MLEVNKDNSKAIPKSSSIKLTKVDGFIIFSLNFKCIIVVDCNALESNQWLLDWFKTQATTTRHKESTIILEICQLRRGETFPIILTVFVYYNKE
jgi:hypothetical protein